MEAVCKHPVKAIDWTGAEEVQSIKKGEERTAHYCCVICGHKGTCYLEIIQDGDKVVADMGLAYIRGTAPHRAMQDWYRRHLRNNPQIKA